MSDEKKYTERDLILAKREGARKMATRCMMTNGGLLPLYQMYGIELDQELARMYPLPKVTRARVVESKTGSQYRIVDGVLETRFGSPSPTSWVASVWNERAPIAARVGDHLDLHAIADLLANPTETCPDE